MRGFSTGLIAPRALQAQFQPITIFQPSPFPQEYRIDCDLLCREGTGVSSDMNQVARTCVIE